MSITKKIKNIKFKKKSDKKGGLIFIESEKLFKNGFKRFFSVSVKQKITKGNHSHRKCTQILFSLSGNIFVLIYKKKNKSWVKYKLKKNENYLVVPPNNFIKLNYPSSKSILGVLCDRNYDPKDYNYKKD